MLTGYSRSRARSCLYLYIFFLCTTALARKLMSPIVAVVFNQDKLEGNFRCVFECACVCVRLCVRARARVCGRERERGKESESESERVCVWLDGCVRACGLVS